jgi:poly-gamma-glutamate capsule biosynthesis protein CapA/YwtB (metallophosphatase superfamily)
LLLKLNKKWDINMSLSFKDGKEVFREPIGSDIFSTLITGDCCPWEKAIKTIQAGGAAKILADVKPFIDDTDIKIIQFEAPLTNDDTPKDKSGPNLKCPPGCLELVQSAGFDVALLANNHIGDHGGAVTMETIKRFNDAGIKTVGAGKKLADAKLPLEIEYQGIKIAVLNFAENEFGIAKIDYAGCAPLAPLDNIKAIRAAKQTADLVFVVVHGGHERNPVPSPRMVETYRAFAEAGASMVMNIHTHCPEGIELWNGVPIVYSPGNLFFPWDDLTSDHLNAMWWVGYMPKFYCDRNGVYALEITPYRFDNKQIYALTSEEKKEFFKYLSTLSELIIDFEVRQSYFEAWTAHEGSRYLTWLRDRLAKWPIELNSRSAVRDLLPARNLFTCESHNDLVTQYLRLVEENRVNSALEGWEKIAKLQRPEWAEKHWQKRLQN